MIKRISLEVRDVEEILKNHFENLGMRVRGIEAFAFYDEGNCEIWNEARFTGYEVKVEVLAEEEGVRI